MGARRAEASPDGRSSRVPLVASLLLLCEIDRLALEDVQERLGRFKDLHVRRLSFLDGLVVLVARLSLSNEALVNLLQTVGEDGKLLLDLGLVLLLFEDLTIQLLTLLA